MFLLRLVRFHETTVDMNWASVLFISLSQLEKQLFVQSGAMTVDDNGALSWSSLPVSRTLASDYSCEVYRVQAKLAMMLKVV